MRRLGHKKTKTKVEGHQQCGDCHPYLKSGRDLEKRRWRRDVLSF